MRRALHCSWCFVGTTVARWCCTSWRCQLSCLVLRVRGMSRRRRAAAVPPPCQFRASRVPLRLTGSCLVWCLCVPVSVSVFPLQMKDYTCAGPLGGHVQFQSIRWHMDDTCHGTLVACRAADFHRPWTAGEDDTGHVVTMLREPVARMISHHNVGSVCWLRVAGTCMRASLPHLCARRCAALRCAAADASGG